MNGPRLEIVADCSDCKWLRSERGSNNYGGLTQSDWVKYRCAHIAQPQSLPCFTRTPETCPLLPAAREKFISDLKGGSDA